MPLIQLPNLLETLSKVESAEKERENDMSDRSVSATESALPQQKTEQTPGAVGRDDDRNAAAVHPPLTAADRRAIERLVTADDTPVDNRFSEKRRRLLTSPLYSSWAGPGGDRPFMACADVGVFLHPREAPLVPDVFLSLDLNELQEPWAKEGRSYFIWEYKKAPDVVIEVVSNEKGGEMTGQIRAVRLVWRSVLRGVRPVEAGAGGSGTGLATHAGCGLHAVRLRPAAGDWAGTSPVAWAI